LPLIAVLAWFASTAPAALAADRAVTVGCNFYSPETVTITEGDSVTWTNTCGFHDVVFDDGSFREPPQPQFPPWSATRTFTRSGSSKYYCSEHGSPGGVGMAGIVVVNARESAQEGSPPPGSQAPGRTGPGVTPNAAPLAKRRCVSRRNFVIRIRQPGGVRIRSAKVSVNGTPVRVRQRRIAGRMRHTADVDLRGLPRGTYEANIAVTTASGRVLRGTRKYRTCAGKRSPAALPRL
jgi:plastocyanin